MDQKVVNANIVLNLKPDTIIPKHMHETSVRATLVQPVRSINERSHPHMKSILNQGYQVTLIHVRLTNNIDPTSNFRLNQTISIYLVAKNWTIDDLRLIPLRSHIQFKTLTPIYSNTKSRRHEIIYATQLTKVIT